MFKLIEMIIASIVCGLIDYYLLVINWFPRIETPNDLIYTLALGFALQAFSQTMWLIGITREDRKNRVYNEPKRRRISPNRVRN